MTKLELIAKINQLRKTNKNVWLNTRIDYNGLSIGIKSYNTWVQILEVNGYKHSSNMDISVKQFNEFLNESLQSLNQYVIMNHLNKLKKAQNDYFR